MALVGLRLNGRKEAELISEGKRDADRFFTLHSAHCTLHSRKKGPEWGVLKVIMPIRRGTYAASALLPSTGSGQAGLLDAARGVRLSEYGLPRANKKLATL